MLQHTTVADAGFLEGGFCYIIAREFLKPHPLSVKTTPIFNRFGEKLLALPGNRSVFDRDFCKGMPTRATEAVFLVL